MLKGAMEEEELWRRGRSFREGGGALEKEEDWTWETPTLFAAARLQTTELLETWASLLCPKREGRIPREPFRLGWMLNRSDTPKVPHADDLFQSLWCSWKMLEPSGGRRSLGYTFKEDSRMSICASVSLLLDHHRTDSFALGTFLYKFLFISGLKDHGWESLHLRIWVNLLQVNYLKYFILQRYI